jgi:sugar lactone lactonase YvrE
MVDHKRWLVGLERAVPGFVTGAMLVFTGCGRELPPVDDTRPSQDPRVLNAPATMSDGSPIPSHTTETVATSIEMVSNGAIGGMSIDARGNIYNTNFDEAVWRTAPGGETVRLNGEFSSASGNFPLANGDLLQADYTENKIFRIAPDGSRTVFADGGLDGPVGIVQRAEGDFIVACHRGGYLARVPAKGGPAEVLLADDRMREPNGVTIDPEGNLYVADLDTGIVFKRTPSGDLVELAELPGSGNAHNVVAGDALYVNKIWDHVIYRVDLSSGTYGIVTGTGHAGYADGPTGTATIEEPNGIATNAARDAVYFNTHRGAMGGGRGLVIVRKLVIPKGG